MAYARGTHPDTTGGMANPPLTSCSDTVVKRLLWWAKEEADDPDAFIQVSSGPDKKKLSKVELLQMASKFSHMLKKSGLAFETIANSLPNSLERVVTDLGIILAGGTVMNTHPAETNPDGYYSLLKQSEAKAVIVYPRKDSKEWSLIEKNIGSKPVVHGVVYEYNCDEAPEVRKIIVVSRLDVWQDKHLEDTPAFMTKVEKLEYTFVNTEVAADQLAYIFTTRGNNTGKKKLVPRSHSSLISLGHSFCGLTNFKKEYLSYFNSSPFGSMSGFPYPFFIYGLSVTFIDETESKEDQEKAFLRYWKSICNKRMTLPFPPNFLAETVSRNPNAYLGTHESMVTGFSLTTWQSLKLLGTSWGGILYVYQTAETGIISKQIFFDALLYNDGDCGVPETGVQIRITDSQGLTIGPEQVGHIEVKSPNFYDGKLKSIEKEREESLTADGWFRTNDLGYLSRMGRLIFKARKCDVIFHNSVIVYPRLVEMAIKQCAGVLHAVAVPVPNRTSYQDICAFVVPHSENPATSADVLKFMRRFSTDPDRGEMPVPQHVLIMAGLPKDRDNHDEFDRRLLKKWALDHFLTKERSANVPVII
ncbi:2-hydroxy-7-methoxy-5-methyl-1-naphthoate--CoA ligase [Aplysia californica]|uniref:Medium-chain acyl-CoA ligase ACSF2, mitochondrial n=1 Tax=Aplysia californica TaxID=6500 RepID=A0ABM0JBX5_APLCA|nr:2-hydroxy-7-methoxy-5-methyl-1-naphthoate--CoA ligase [Aplysia californica]